ncbi:MAG: hypothetical protein OSJ44_16245, partial [Lachnospiraceae bacterium]|nr:hypothetical protein [Lachnospiraceae bacterium]
RKNAGKAAFFQVFHGRVWDAASQIRFTWKNAQKAGIFPGVAMRNIANSLYMEECKLGKAAFSRYLWLDLCCRRAAAGVGMW